MQRFFKNKLWQEAGDMLTVFFAILLFVGGLFAVAQLGRETNAATPPSLIIYQGKLFESGSGVTSTQAMKFVLYDAAENGNVLYTASGTLAVPATVDVTFSTSSVGLFSVTLGDTAGTPEMNAITSSIFADNASIYLEIEVDGTTLSPRKRIGSAPYAINSQYLMGYSPQVTGTAEAYIPLADSNGNFTFTGSSTSNGVDGGIIYINPSNVGEDHTLFGIAVSGTEKFRIDEDGDTTIVGNLNVSSTLTIDVVNNRVGVNSSTPNYALSVVGDTYVSGESTFAGLTDIDGKIHNPAQVGQVTLLEEFQYLEALFVQGNYVYAAGGQGGLNPQTIYVVDVSDKTNPTEVSSIVLNQNIYDLYAMGDYLYAAVDQVGLVVLDVSDKKNIQQLAAIKDELRIGADIRTVRGAGNFIYVGDAQGAAAETLYVIDVSDPSAPQKITGFITGADTPVEMALNDRYLFVLGTNNGLSIIDMIDPYNPVTTTVNFSPDPVGVGFQEYTNVSLDEDNIFVVKGPAADRSGIYRVSVADVTSPTLIVSSSLSNIKGFDVVGDFGYAIVDGQGEGTFSVLDFRESNTSTVFSSTSSAQYESSFGAGVHIVDGYAYIATDRYVSIIDIRGTRIANADIGSGKITDLSVTGESYLQNTYVRGGLRVGYSGLQVSGDASFLANSTTPSGTNTLRFSHTALFNSSVTSTDSEAFIFNAVNGLSTVDNTASLLEVHNNDNTAFRVAANGDVIVSSSLFASDVSLTSNLEVDGNLTVTGTVYVVGTSTFAGNIVMTGDAATFTTTTFNGDLTFNSAGVGDTATNTLTFSHNGLFKSNVANTETYGFIFDVVNGLATANSSTYLLSVRNAGTSAFSVSANGDVAASGTLYAENAAVGTPGVPGDVAERVDVREDNVEAGEVMVVDWEAVDRYRRSYQPYQSEIAGVISTAPSIIVGDGLTKQTAVMAIVGRVPVKVSGENGPIQKGDILVSASTPGYAMRYDPEKVIAAKLIGVVGIALDDFDGREAEFGTIMTLLRSGWVSR